MLDKDKPYGIIYPSFDGARFEQDNKFFDGNGKLIITEKVKETAKRGRPPKNVEK